MDLSFLAAQVWDVWHYALKIWVLHEHQPVHFKRWQHVSLEPQDPHPSLMVISLLLTASSCLSVQFNQYQRDWLRLTGLLFWYLICIFIYYLYLLDFFWLIKSHMSPLEFLERDHVPNCAQTDQDTKARDQKSEISLRSQTFLNMWSELLHVHFIHIDSYYDTIKKCGSVYKEIAI